MPTYPFGDNRIIYNTNPSIPQPIQIQLKYTGNWNFDLREFVQLAESLFAIEWSGTPFTPKIWRTIGGGSLEVADEGTGYVFFRDGAREGHFLSNEVSDLVNGIRQIIAPVHDYAFNGNVIKLYKNNMGKPIPLYALSLRSITLGRGTWVFDKPEIRQLDNILSSFPPKGQITRSNRQSQVAVTREIFIEFKEGNHKNRFEGNELRDAIRYMQDL